MNDGAENGNHNFKSETTIGQFLLDVLGLDKLKGAGSGKPDAMAATGPRSAIFFDFKPVKHVNRPDLQYKDKEQASRWMNEAAVRGIILEPATPAEFSRAVENGVIVGHIWGTDDRQYSVTTDTGKIDGIAYYSLTPTGVTLNASDILRNFVEGVRQAIPPSNPIVPVPVPIPLFR